MSHLQPLSPGNIRSHASSTSRFSRALSALAAIVVVAVGFAATQSASATPTVNPSSGMVDPEFNVSGSGANDSVRSVAVQPDGKILIAGLFTSYNGVAAKDIIRLNTDGTVDESFDIGAGFSNWPTVITLQSDGKILAGGAFSSYQGHTAQGIVRLNSDGSWDDTFVSPFTPYAPVTNTNPYVQNLVAQSDGSIIIVGDFHNVAATTVGHIAKLSSTGTLDTTFNDNLGEGTSGTPTLVNLQSDGKILVGGNFSAVSGDNTKKGVVRLNANGTVDSGYAPTLAGPSPFPLSMALQSDGKLVLAGMFTGFGSTATGFALRLNSDGTLDTGFNAGGAGFAGTGKRASAISIDPDGRIYVAGTFLTYNGNAIPNLVRLTSSGDLDTSFVTGTGIAHTSAYWIYQVAALPSGDVFVGGLFTTYNDTAANFTVMLTSEEAIAARHIEPVVDPTEEPSGSESDAQVAGSLAATGTASAVPLSGVGAFSALLGIGVSVAAKRARRQHS